MKQEFGYGFRNSNLGTCVIFNNNGGAYPEVHFIQNIYTNIFLSKKKLFSKSSMFSFFFQKKIKLFFKSLTLKIIKYKYQGWDEYSNIRIIGLRILYSYSYS